MVKVVEEKETTGSPVRELFQSAIYKRTQGRITRQVTFFALAIALVWGAWRFSVTMIMLRPEWRFGVPVILVLVGLWCLYRLVNMPRFADFLIAVEAEMNKVSWPSRGELFRASLVVMVVIFFMAAVLYFYDLVLTWLFAFFEGLVARLFG
jgi:preprotein translocase subunit SecE